MWGLDQAIANSARQAEEISRVFEEQRKAERQHRERLEEGATSSIEQKNSLKNRLVYYTSRTGFFRKIMIS